MVASGSFGSIYRSFGGGLYFNDGSFQFNSSIMAYNSIQAMGPRTRATGEVYGGGLYLSTSTPFVVKDSVVIGNWAASNGTANGGGASIYSAGTWVSTRISDNQVLGRTTALGGGVLVLATGALVMRNVSRAISKTSRRLDWAPVMTCEVLAWRARGVRNIPVAWRGTDAICWPVLPLYGSQVTMRNNSAEATGIGAASARGGGMHADVPTCTLSGVILSRNTAAITASIGSTSTIVRGGGLSCVATTLSIANSSVTDNVVAATVVNSQTVSINGGGMSQSGHLIVNRTSFLRNVIWQSGASTTAGDGFGGGLYHITGVLVATAVTVVGNRVDHPFSVQGGGIHSAGSGVTITRSTVASNNASSAMRALGGGIYLTTSASPIVLQKLTLRNNTAAALAATTATFVRGGGAYVDSSSRGASISGLTVVNNLASLATSVSGTRPVEGGGLHVTGSLPVGVTNCSFVGNQVVIVGSSSLGTVYGRGGGLFQTVSGTCNFTQFVGNSISITGIVGGSSHVSLTSSASNLPPTSLITTGRRL